MFIVQRAISTVLQYTIGKYLVDDVDFTLSKMGTLDLHNLEI